VEAKSLSLNSYKARAISYAKLVYELIMKRPAMTAPISPPINENTTNIFSTALE
jgi:hypothetical protein